jgi:hypothetical protein
MKSRHDAPNPAFEAALARFYEAGERRRKSRRLPYPPDKDDEFDAPEPKSSKQTGERK